MSDHAFCPYCHKGFLYRDREAPPHCGSLACRAKHEWSQEQWDGRARMANARVACCLPLDELDTLALERESF